MYLFISLYLFGYYPTKIHIQIKKWNITFTSEDPKCCSSITGRPFLKEEILTETRAVGRVSAACHPLRHPKDQLFLLVWESELDLVNLLLLFSTLNLKRETQIDT